MDNEFINFITKRGNDMTTGNIDIDNKIEKISSLLSEKQAEISVILDKAKKIDNDFGNMLLGSVITSSLIANTDNFDETYKLLDNIRKNITHLEGEFNKNG